jgi:hypothetical protein
LLFKSETWELLGLLLTAGGSLFGLTYGSVSLGTPVFTFRGVVFAGSPEAALGLASLALTALSSFTAIVIGQFRRSSNNAGALLIIWTDFIVILFGDILFYLYLPQAGEVMLIGLASAVLTAVGLMVIANRPRVSP